MKNVKTSYSVFMNFSVSWILFKIFSISYFLVLYVIIVTLFHWVIIESYTLATYDSVATGG